MAEQRVFAKPEELAQAVAVLTIQALGAAVERSGTATWVLAGGSTPAAAYRLLAQDQGALPWDRLNVLMGDERCVAVDHPDSNWGQAAAALLDHVPVDGNRLLVPEGTLPPDEAAARYAAALAQVPTDAAGLPRLDHVWLGVGEDGHTLSLFPGLEAVEVTDRLVAGVHNSPKPPPERLTLTLRALRGAQDCLIIAAGAGKAEVIARALRGDVKLPVARAAQAVEEAGGRVTWLLDEAAAAHIG
ncbi:6-phosphogluconolactonase [Streptomyces silaceus]|uniref:6-phosphogluconolactonase n=1 Tax=Streptomyces silaceus TaxID=545123 RepID=UPI0006EB6FDF|nr:6-phosphogluconolactonase [Streptomyces silaceus]MCF3125229.1 6-phosphogluconolactonase [Streptomyces arenae]